MRIRLVLLFFVIYSLLLGIIAYCLIKKFYLSDNLLRYDPLGINKFDVKQIENSQDLKNVWMVGDSRIARWNKELIASPNLNVKNLGFEGQTSSQVLNRLKNYLENETPQCIILEVGINDLKIIGLKKNLYSQIESQCYENITSIIDLCLGKDIKVIFLNIFPTGDIEFLRRFIWNNSVDSAIINVNNRLRQFCDLRNVYYYDSNMLLCKENMVVKDIYQDGFLHINDSAYEALSKDLIKNSDLHNPQGLNSKNK